MRATCPFLLASFNIAKVSQAKTYQNKRILQPFVDFAESNLYLLQQVQTSQAYDKLALIYYKFYIVFLFKVSLHEL